MYMACLWLCVCVCECVCVCVYSWKGVKDELRGQTSRIKTLFVIRVHMEGMHALGITLLTNKEIKR